MKQIFLAFVVCGVLTGPAWGVVEGNFVVAGAGAVKCSKYMSVYGQSGLELTGVKWSSRVGFHEYTGFINGYITGVNGWLKGKENWFEGLSVGDVAAWLSSWCRDNPSKPLAFGMEALFLQHNKK